MDIQFIQEEHRDNIFKIMQLCNVEMAEAYQLYNNHGCNVQAAVQAKFNPFSQNKNSGTFGSNFQTQKPAVRQNRYQTNQRVVYDIDEYENYKLFKESQTNFNQRYQVRKKQGFFSGFLSKFTSSSNQNNFKRKLQQFIGGRVNLQLQMGNLSQTLQQIWKTQSGFPLIVHVIDFNNKLVKDKIKSVYRDENLARKFNQEYKNYGIVPNDYELETFLAEFIDLNSDLNCLIVLRINVMDEISLLSKIKIDSLSPIEISKKLGEVKSKSINIQMQEHHMKNRYKQELKGNFDYQKPMSVAEQRKLKEDRELRRKQEEEFFASMQPKKIQQKPANIPSQYNEMKTISKAQVKKEQPKKDLKKQSQQERKRIRQGLKVYSGQGENILSIKLRLPSSQSLKLFVSSLQPAQYLYDYVFSRQQDLGFQNDQQRRVFDIIEPYDKINLSERKKEVLGQIFQGESMLSLVVSEVME